MSILEKLQLQISSILYEYNISIHLLSKRMQNASPEEIKNINQKIEKLHENFLTEVSSYKENAYKEIEIHKKNTDEDKIKNIREFLKK
ncbi:hypothetical protein HOG48_05800 [Candidatus Peregrinibacteria bacterium]|jgi:hypothetical protein|nr:hypothetical protein [Candidatus Peregrinibacteria bacterium]